MLDFVQILALLTVMLAAVPAVAHALELPGKMRLSKEPSPEKEVRPEPTESRDRLEADGKRAVTPQ